MAIFDFGGSGGGWGRERPDIRPLDRGRLALTIQQIKARRAAAESFGRRPAPQGANGPGITGQPGVMNPSLGQRFVAHGYRTQPTGGG